MYSGLVLCVNLVFFGALGVYLNSLPSYNNLLGSVFKFFIIKYWKKIIRHVGEVTIKSFKNTLESYNTKDIYGVNSIDLLYANSKKINYIKLEELWFYIVQNVYFIPPMEREPIEIQIDKRGYYSVTD